MWTLWWPASWLSWQASHGRQSVDRPNPSASAVSCTIRSLRQMSAPAARACSGGTRLQAAASVPSSRPQPAAVVARPWGTTQRAAGVPRRHGGGSGSAARLPPAGAVSDKVSWPMQGIKPDATAVIGNTPLVRRAWGRLLLGCGLAGALRRGLCLVPAAPSPTSPPSSPLLTVLTPAAAPAARQVRLNKVNQMCHADIVCKLEGMEPCSSGACAGRGRGGWACTAACLHCCLLPAAGCCCCPCSLPPTCQQQVVCTPILPLAHPPTHPPCRHLAAPQSRTASLST